MGGFVTVLLAELLQILPPSVLDNRKNERYNNFHSNADRYSSSDTAVAMIPKRKDTMIMSSNRSRKSKKKHRMPGMVLTLLLLVVSILFLFMLSLTQLLTNTHVIAAAVICLLAVLLTFLLTRNFRNRLTFVLGTAWWLICLGVFAVGGVYLFQTQSTLRTIAGIQTEASNISAYVLTDDPAQTLTDASGYSFGILSTLDRENTDTVVSRINEQLGTTIQTAEYAGLTQLADGLRNGGVGAVILNDAYLDLYEEFDGYTDFPTSVRALTTEVVETTIVDPADQAQASAAPSLDENPVLNIYISGSDTRSSTLPSRSRSDVNILASINTQTRQVLLISTPRDYYVPLSISNGAPDKLTHAGIYGVQVSMDTLSMLYEVPVDYYFRVNFNGFVDIIDALGGIEVYSDYTFDTGNVQGYHFNEGWNTVNGEEALAFCRERYAFSSGDRQRGKNQMAVIQGVLNKATSPAILTSYTSVLNSAEGCMETNVPYDTIAEIVRQQLSDGGNWNVVSYSVDGTGDSQVPYSMSSSVYVMIPDTSTVDQAKSLLAQVAAGETLQQP